MPNLSGIKKVEEVLSCESVIIYDIPKGGRPRTVSLDENRKYIVPGYQREIRWSTENVQMLIDDLKKGSKFLGTITLSTSKPKEFEIIDGQQRLTVITLIVSCLNQFVIESKGLTNTCEIDNLSFPYFNDALKYKFDYERIKNENLSLFNNIMLNDSQNQKNDFRRIWNGIVERVDLLTQIEKENLLRSLCESELNVIVNEIEGTDTQKKFCIDYFIDINNKSVELDSLDIIRAYAFKEDFTNTTFRWVEIQRKCNELNGKVKYTREELYFQYFICNVNKEIGYKITKLSNDYRIKEDVELNGKKYASGTYIWNTFKNDRFYSQLLIDLNDYLDFIDIVIGTETGGLDSFKKFFYTDSGEFADETRILNAHTVINSILRNDDLVPKMMIMKYFFEVLRPEKVKNNRYRIISSINIVATVFTMSVKRKGSEVIASKLLQEDWQKGIRECAIKMYQDVPQEIAFGRIAKENKQITVDSGLHAARRYYSMVDSCSICPGSISIDEEVFKNENITSGDKSIEHFLINREYSYALYLEDGNTVDIDIMLPKKYKKNIATIANYLIMNSSINRKLKNRPVFEKIEMLEDDIKEQGIDTVIPSRESKKHYYIIKKILHDESKYPKRKLDESRTKMEKKKELRSYYQKYFEDELNLLTASLSNPEKMFAAEIEYELKKIGFVREEDWFVIERDSQFANVEAEIDEKSRKIIMSAELYNPTFAEGNDLEEYEEMIDKTVQLLTARFGCEPEVRSSNEYGGSEDESFTFTYVFEAEIQNVIMFLEELKNISINIA